MSTTVTSGKTRTIYAKLYDRLRKRSLRAMGTKTLADFAGHNPYLANYQLDADWSDFEHVAYVAGVRDALNAISFELDPA